MTGAIAAIKSGLEILGKLPIKEGLGATASWLIKGSPIVLRTLSLVFALVFVLLGTAMWKNISAANQIMMGALGSPLQETAHPDTAIEALLLASILKQQIVPALSNGPANPAAQAPPRFSSDFDKDLQLIDEKIHKSIEPPNASHDLSKPDSSKLVHLEVVKDTDDTSPAERIFSDSNDGFLFVPGSIIGPGTETAKDNGINISAAANPELYRDIAASQAASVIFCGSFHERYLVNNQGRVNLFQSDPTAISVPYLQAYLIFASGVTRICESSSRSGWKYQREYYQDRFPASTHLERRPYFQPTVDTKNGSKTYWTQPYFDLGGNGLIQTVCRYIPIESSNAVLCFDFRLQADITSAIQSLVGEFGGSVTGFECAGKSCTISTPAPAGTSWSEAFSNLYPKATLTSLEIDTIKKKYADSADSKTESDLTGGINIIKLEPTKGLLVILVPTGDNRLLAVKVDLASYQWWRSFWLIVVAGAGATTLVLSILMLADYGLKFKEQERAFNAVDTIMTDVPAPYARVDEEDKFIKINESFAKLMGFTSVDGALAELKQHSFGSFLAEGKDTYQNIKEERRAGKPYRSYIVCLWTGGGPGKEPKTWVKVHGGDVPTPHAARKKIGQSFGILLKTDPPGPKAVLSSEDPEITEKRA